VILKTLKVLRFSTPSWPEPWLPRYSTKETIEFFLLWGVLIVFVCMELEMKVKEFTVIFMVEMKMKNYFLGFLLNFLGFYEDQEEQGKEEEQN